MRRYTRYVMSTNDLGAEVSGIAVDFIANVRNVVVSIEDRDEAVPEEELLMGQDSTVFNIFNEDGNIIETVSAGTSTVDVNVDSFGQARVIPEDDFVASWTIPFDLQGETLSYQFEIRDANGFLMGRGDLKNLRVVKDFIYVDANNSSGIEDGTIDNPYREIETALNDNDIFFGEGSLQIAAGNYPDAITIDQKVVIESTGGRAFIGR